MLSSVWGRARFSQIALSTYGFSCSVDDLLFLQVLLFRSPHPSEKRHEELDCPGHSSPAPIPLFPAPCSAVPAVYPLSSSWTPSHFSQQIQYKISTNWVAAWYWVTWNGSDLPTKFLIAFSTPLYKRKNKTLDIFNHLDSDPLKNHWCILYLSIKKDHSPFSRQPPSQLLASKSTAVFQVLLSLLII